MRVKLSGLILLINKSDYRKFVQGKSWRVKNSGKHYKYICNSDSSKYLHRIMMDCPKGMVVDHINGNGLDNRRRNLRICTNAENIRNSVSRRRVLSIYRGIAKIRNSWHAQISFNNKMFYSPCVKSPKEAAIAYDEMAIKYHGEFARLNFPIKSKKLFKQKKSRCY